MKRPDWEMIRKIGKSKTMPESVVKLALSLPYFYLSDKPVREQPFMQDSSEEVLEEHSPNLARTRQIVSNAEMVYERFIMCVRANVSILDPDTGEYSNVETHYWGWIGPHNTLCLYFDYADRKSDIWHWMGRVIISEEDDGKIGKVEPVPSQEYLDSASAIFKSQFKGKSEFDRYIKGLSQQAGQFYVYVMRLMNYLKYGDKHLVEVTPSKPPKKNPALHKKRPWAGATGPRILFLDRMPTTQSESTGTHASPKPHRRRGHWKTLRHPRFRHHPQYQQKIYCKPSFVGPRQVNYEGNIYRLVQPLEDMEIAS
jgi:hypothetical protein